MGASLQQDLIRSFTQWLETESGYSSLLRITQKTLRQLGPSSPILMLLPYGFSHERYSVEMQESVEEIAHDFLVFLLTSFCSLLEKHPEFINDLTAGRTNQLLHYGFSRFLAHWREKSRSKEHNPRGYLYRRARQIVVEDNRFISRLFEKLGTDYAPSEINPLPVNRLIVAEKNYAAMEPPPSTPDIPPEQYVFTASFLASAALFFYNKIHKDLQEFFFVPVREYVRFLAAHYPWLDRPQVESLGDEQFSLERFLPEDKIDLLNGLKSVQHLAGQFVADLDSTEAGLLVLKLGENVTPLREIAERLGLKDHNAAYRLWVKVQGKLRRFMLSSPGPAWSELPEEVSVVFIAEVKNKCKKMLS